MGLGRWRGKGWNGGGERKEGREKQRRGIEVVRETGKETKKDRRQTETGRDRDERDQEEETDQERQMKRIRKRQK